MRILIYCDDPGNGGTSVNASVLGEGLARLGFSVSVAAYGDWTSCLAGVTTHSLDYNPKRFAAKTILSRNEPESIILHDRPDLVLFCDCAVDSSLAAKAVCRDWGIPHIIQSNYVSAAHLSRLGPHFAPAGEAIRKAEAVVAVSTENLLLLRQAFGLSGQRAGVIYNGRPPYWFEPTGTDRRDDIRAAWGINPEDVLCLTVARYEPRKGYRHLLEVASALTKYGLSKGRLLFVWIGQHQEGAAEKLAADVASCGLSGRVLVLGERKDVRDWLVASDLFLLLSESEGMPLCIIEAMGQGVPVIASAISGIPEELGDAGVLVPDPGRDPYGAVAAMVEVVIALAANPARRKTLGARGRQRALAYFSAERMISDFAKLARTLVSSRRPTCFDERTYCPPHLLPFGHELHLGNDAVAMEFLKEGWSHGEGEGRWTDGDQARLHLVLPEDCRDGLVLTCGIKPFLGRPGSTLELRLAFNGREVGLLRWNEAPAEAQRVSLPIPPDGRSYREVELILSLTGVSSPAALGLSEDGRQLGVWVTFLRLDRLQASGGRSY
jgi:glycosyltransferase involved in cell wall biosynthesis